MEQLELIFIPYGSNAIVIPKTLVEYILPYAPPLPSDYKNPALVGSLIYKNSKVPVLDIEKLQDPKSEIVSNQSSGKRLIILSAISPQSQIRHYAIIAVSPPRIVDISEDMIEEIAEDKSELLYSKIKFGNDYSHQYAYIFDLEKLEKTLFSH